jgi:multiple sugar transport system permease protein
MTRFSAVAINLALMATIVVFGAPLLWVIVLAFDRHTGASWPWPQDPTFDNFRVLFSEMEIRRSLRNSLIVSTGVMLVAVATSALAGFGLSRLDVKGKSLVVYGLLLLYSFPLAATMVPINDLARRLDLFNTYRGLILAQAATVLPLTIWLMKGYFDAVPRSLEEAAEVDGCSRARAWLEILVPLVRSGLAVVAGLSFFIAWSDVILVTALVRGLSMATVSLRFMTAAQEGLDAPIVAALGLIYIGPVLLLFVVLRRAIMRGFASAAYSA